MSHSAFARELMSSLQDEQAKGDPKFVVYLTADPDLAANLKAGGHHAVAWGPHTAPSEVRDAAEVIVLSPATEDALLDSSGCLNWAARHASGVVFKAVLAGLHVESRDLREWAERGGNLEAVITESRKNAVAGRGRRGSSQREPKCAATTPNSSPPSTVAGDDVPEHPYQVVGGRLCRMTLMRDGGSFPSPLCNFDAKIVEEVCHDDGAERTMRLRIAVTLASGAELPTVEVSAAEFPRMDWPLSRCGSRAIVFAGQGAKDHLRAAIQLMSADAEHRVVYGHLGWRLIDGGWHFLHAGGAIGPNGPKIFAVEPPDGLRGFVLPDPPAGDRLAAAARAALSLAAGLAPDRVMLPLLCLVVRSVLRACSFAGHLVGRTGAGKTELAALMQQFFGASLDAKHLPGSWSSTANSLEALAFAAQDVVMVVDDFNPHGSRLDVARFHKDADRLLRAQGNHSGRQRMRPDGSLRPPRPPRGTVLSTGEDTPRGHSLRARLLVIEVEPGDIDFEKLTSCQQDAATGAYAEAMAGYLAWLAPQLEGVLARFRQRAVELRGDLSGPGSHRRVPSMIGELLAAFEIFAGFCVEAGALAPGEPELLVARCRKALVDSAEQQAIHQSAADPAERFFALLASAISSGRSHVAAIDGHAPGVPHDPGAWGWRRNADNGWDEQGARVGWIDGDDLVLDPEAAFAEANKLAVSQGESFGVGPNTLYRRLKERHLLASTDPKHNTVRWTIEGARRRVLHLRPSVLWESGPLGPIGPPPLKQAENGPISGTAFSGAAENRSTKSVQNPPENQARGPNGPLSRGNRGPAREMAVATPACDAIDWRSLDPDPF